MPIVRTLRRFVQPKDPLLVELQSHKRWNKVFSLQVLLVVGELLLAACFLLPLFTRYAAIELIRLFFDRLRKMHAAIHERRTR